MLGLGDVVHSIIGSASERGVSGGQRKRVNVGIELCSSPKVLFLDEPTSGLDSTTSLSLCSTLRELVRSQSLACAAVIHQPRYEVFDAFDDLLLRARGGRVAYHGPTALALAYFEARGFPRANIFTNVADHIVDCVDGRVTNVAGALGSADFFAACWAADGPSVLTSIESGALPRQPRAAPEGVRLEMGSHDRSDAVSADGDKDSCNRPTVAEATGGTAGELFAKSVALSMSVRRRTVSMGRVQRRGRLMAYARKATAPAAIHAAISVGITTLCLNALLQAGSMPGPQLRAYGSLMLVVAFASLVHFVIHLTQCILDGSTKYGYEGDAPRTLPLLRFSTDNGTAVPAVLICAVALVVAIILASVGAGAEVSALTATAAALSLTSPAYTVLVLQKCVRPPRRARSIAGDSLPQYSAHVRVSSTRRAGLLSLPRCLALRDGSRAFGKDGAFKARARAAVNDGEATFRGTNCVSAAAGLPLPASPPPLTR